MLRLKGERNHEIREGEGREGGGHFLSRSIYKSWNGRKAVHSYDTITGTYVHIEVSFTHFKFDTF